MSPDGKTSVLFVCLGNICRSPLAEGVMLRLLRDRGLEGHYSVDSAGTGAWHVGEPPDSRSVKVALQNGITLEGAARQFTDEDLDGFDHIIAMDRRNLLHIEEAQKSPSVRARVSLLRAYDSDPGDGEVPDPYYGVGGGFDDVFRIISRSLDGLLDRLEAERLRPDRTP